MADLKQPEPEADLSPGRRRVEFAVGVGWLLVGCVVVAFGSIAALTIVASVQDADALSTVALALAIVAFAIQILVFVVQTQAATQQMVQSERLNTQTRELLTEVNTSAASTQTMVGDQFRELLRAFVQGASTTAAETGKFDPEQFEQRLLTNIERATQAAVGRGARRTPAAPTSSSSDTARRIRERREALRREQAELTEYPADATGRAIAGQLRGLSEPVRRRLLELGQDELTSRETGVYVGLTPEPDVDEQLAENGLVTLARVHNDGSVREIHRLTPKGRQWASLLLATGEVPEYAQGLLPPPAEADDDIPF